MAVNRSLERDLRTENRMNRTPNVIMSITWAVNVAIARPRLSQGPTCRPHMAKTIMKGPTIYKTANKLFAFMMNRNILKVISCTDEEVTFSSKPEQASGSNPRQMFIKA
jgi:hypothetical protein